MAYIAQQIMLWFPFFPKISMWIDPRFYSMESHKIWLQEIYNKKKYRKNSYIHSLLAGAVVMFYHIFMVVISRLLLHGIKENSYNKKHHLCNLCWFRSLECAIKIFFHSYLEYTYLGIYLVELYKINPKNTYNASYWFNL